MAGKGGGFWRLRRDPDDPRVFDGILVGEAVYRRAKTAPPGVVFRPVGPVSLKGKSEAMELYAVEEKGSGSRYSNSQDPVSS